MNPYRLYLVTDDQQDIATLKKVVKQAIQGGVTAVQIREKHGDIQAFIARATAIKTIIQGTGIPLIINDRVDVALAVQADGIHLGQSDMPVATARRLVGDKMIIGLSVEDETQLAESQHLPIDYIGLSAIFSTPTKTDTLKEWGLEGLKHAVKKSQQPIVAIGGINKTNINEVSKTGVDGIALVTAICHSDNPELTSKELLTLMQY
ncbi:thiamine phosphate synthase [Vibrio algarum]|uniref:Thiamine-phosphate synthase n=1 Tax=Vibrio algarum TaxID=3020714 RepID=A0ABT4YPS3_9VIBR|nr:thiamine phosphate synthase [Vibrio sp. KJ40-1]MDB1123201.1 thiamine phosphate synthase [Vibrio sp. KJ40-1]